LRTSKTYVYVQREYDIVCSLNPTQAKPNVLRYKVDDSNRRQIFYLKIKNR